MLSTVLPDPVSFFGVDVSGSQGGYKFLDRTAFALDKKSRFGYSATLFGGSLFSTGATSLTGAVTYARNYKAADPVTLCQPLTGTVQQQCFTAADGAPTRNVQTILSVELRHAFDTDVGTFPKFAIAPQFSADVKNDAYSVSLPFYFMGDDVGKLRGGVRAVYLNEKDEDGGRKGSFGLGVFVGVPFNVLRD